MRRPPLDRRATRCVRAFDCVASCRATVAASLDRPCRSHPHPAAHRPARDRHRRRAGHRRARSPVACARVRCRRGDLRPRRRRSRRVPRPRSRPPAAARSPRLLDVRDGDAVRDVGRDRSSRVDVLVNNAGGGFRSPFLDVNDKGQDSLIRENFTSVTNFVRAAVPLMPAGGRRRSSTSRRSRRTAPARASRSTAR